jgi:sterol carrier protein 2
VVTVYKRAGGKANTDGHQSELDCSTQRLGYNPAVEARYITWEQAESARNKNAHCNYALNNTIDHIEKGQVEL